VAESQILDMLARIFRKLDDGYVMRTIRTLHKNRLIEFTEKTGKVRILPPGTKAIEELIRKKNLTGIV
jgi:hypothetical protein